MYNISKIIDLLEAIKALKEYFSGNSVKISDCRVFSLFETLPGCRAFRHSVNRFHDFIVALITLGICIFLFNTRPHKFVSFEFSSCIYKGCLYVLSKLC